MAMEAGSIVEGKVTRITNFGAFVELEEGKVGLIHISEVAEVYVNDVHDFLSEGDTVNRQRLSRRRLKILNKTTTDAVIFVNRKSNCQPHLKISCRSF